MIFPLSSNPLISHHSATPPRSPSNSNFNSKSPSIFFPRMKLPLPHCAGPSDARQTDRKGKEGKGKSDSRARERPKSVGPEVRVLYSVSW